MLKSLSHGKPAPLDADASIISRMLAFDLIGTYHVDLRLYIITPHGKGVLRDMHRCAEVAMLQAMARYLK